MRNTMRRIFRFMRIKKRIKQKENRALCYSVSGFLVDLIEQNGFYVRGLKTYGNNTFDLEVQLCADEKLFRERLKRISESKVIKF